MRLSFFVLISTLAGMGNALAASEQDGANSEPLRLEATIRANKEQPRVLSIVPWQLPQHRQINGALSWQPQLSVPAMIERNQFIQQLGQSSEKPEITASAQAQ
ncbi:hypothetical protein DXV75_04305 [Alteromonas aestuariivivens]|uniref:Uncharacterized protein n=1 Tax=Alteromonas aestuariivivens TaxID=1938339 RepID=A0A3D8MD18_9ALTE|nr:hypothetical protein [Alteromonas aestuariivivens]RDV28185.1 hypothetical protein DXV75_04305 [Alteromonas aestuariivivens]